MNEANQNKLTLMDDSSPKHEKMRRLLATAIKLKQRLLEAYDLFAKYAFDDYFNLNIELDRLCRKLQVHSFFFFFWEPPKKRNAPKVYFTIHTCSVKL